MRAFHWSAEMVHFLLFYKTMVSNSQANAQLELCCRLGSLDGIREALEDGADINCNGNSPLFLAVMANDGPVVAFLLENGADTSTFGVDSGGDPEEVVNALMALAPSTGSAAESESEAEDADKVDAKLVRAFDRFIRAKGLSWPIEKGRLDEYPKFREGLKWIAAEECEASVGEFLDLIEAGLSENGADGVRPLLDDHADRVAELSERYTSADEVPGDLLKDYLKEQKKKART